MFMRRLLPALFLVSAALLGVEPAAPAGLATVVASDPVLPLGTALDRALTHNLGLAVNRLDAANAQIGRAHV